MQDLDIKRGHYSLIADGQLQELMKENFGNVKEDGEWLVSSFKALDPIKVSIKSKKVLCIDINTKQDVADDDAMESIRAKNNFLQAATGFSAKERSKRLQKKAKEGKI